MANSDLERIKSDLRDKLYCVVDPDGDEILMLGHVAEEILNLRNEHKKALQAAFIAGAIHEARQPADALHSDDTGKAAIDYATRISVAQGG